MDLQLPNSDRLCFGNYPVKKRSKRKPANVKENMELAGLLFKLARASRRSNNNGSNSSSSSMPSPKTLTVQMKKKKKAVDVAEQVVFPRATSSSSSRRYVCSVCNMSFSCHQALGGHKSSHKLKKQKTTTVLDDVELHKYAACHESFPIGQALGGDMRGHCGEVKAVNINLNVPDLPGMEISSLSNDEPRIPLLLLNETSPSPSPN